MLNMDMPEDDDPEPEPDPPFNPCFCCTDLDLRRATIFVAVFSLFYHAAIMVSAFALYIYYPDQMNVGRGLLTFRMACLIVGIVHAFLIPVSSLIFIGAVKNIRKYCIYWLFIIIPSTLADIAGLIVEQAIHVVFIEVAFFVTRAFTVWVVWSFVIDLGQKEAARKVAELRRSEQLRFSQAGSNNPSGDGGGSELILTSEGELVD